MELFAITFSNRGYYHHTGHKWDNYTYKEVHYFRKFKMKIFKTQKQAQKTVDRILKKYYWWKDDLKIIKLNIEGDIKC